MTARNSSVSVGTVTGDGWTPRRVVIVFTMVGSLVGAIATVLLGPQGLPIVSKEFATSQGAWFVTAELLASAVVTPLIARMAELHGKRRMMLVSMALGIVGSVLVAVAPWYWLSLAGRFLQGATLASAVLAPAIVRETFPARIAPLGVGLVATGSGLPGALIPFITGPVIDHFGYRYVFGGLAVVMALLSMAIAAVIGESKVIDSGKVDYLGAVLMGVGVGAVLAGVSLGPTSGWSSPVVLSLLIGGVVVGVLWVQTALRRDEPLIDLSMLRNGRISAGIAVGGMVAGTGTLFLITSELASQTSAGAGLGYGFGLSSSSYAWLQTFYFLGFLVGGVIAVPALRRMSYLNVVLGGLALLAVSAIVGLLSLHQIVVFGAVHLAFGIVIGTFFSANFNFIFAMVEPARRSSAASLYLTATTGGQSLFSVLPISLATLLYPVAAQGTAALPGLRFYFYFVLGVVVLSAIPAALVRRAPVGEEALDPA